MKKNNYNPPVCEDVICRMANLLCVSGEGNASNESFTEEEFIF